MLDNSYSRIQINAELPLSDVTLPVEEGMALQYVVENGVNKVTRATGAATSNLFAGVAMSYFRSPTQAPAVDVLTVDPTTYTVTLSQTPTAAAAILVKNVFIPTSGNTSPIGGSTVYTYDTGAVAPASGHYIVSAGLTTLTFNANSAGQQVYVVYLYALTAQQAAALVGDGILATQASDVTGTIGVIQRGIVYTSNYDPVQDWGATDINNITIAAGGIFTRGGTGAPCPRVLVHTVPTGDQPFLGLMLS